MTTTATESTFAGQTRQATEKSLETWKQGTQTLTDQVTTLLTPPAVDLQKGVEQYFELLQMAVDLNRQLSITWVGFATSLSASMREQADSFSHVVTGRAETVADLTSTPARQAEELANGLGRRPERDDAAKARAQYEGLTKADLSDRLTDRGLPHTGTVEELIQRLVTADTT